MDSNRKRPKVFYGWYIVGACLVIILYTGGVVHFGFTAIFEPIAEEFGWSYAHISLAGSLRGLEMGLFAPLMGLLVDRWGPRKLILGGSILICTGLLLLSRITSLVTFYGAFALIAVGMSTCTSTVIMTVVTNWFRRRAGLAIGIVSSGWGLGGVLVPVITRLIDILQWRMAMVAAGLGTLIIVSPLSMLLRHKPEHYGYQVDGDVSNTTGTKKVQPSTTPVEVNINAKQALRNRAFWHLAISGMCHMFASGAVVTHIMPYLSSLNIARSVSSLVAFLLPVVTIGGRLGSSWLSDRFSSRLVYTAGFALMTAGLLIFGNVAAGKLWLLAPFVITFSLGWGLNVPTRISLHRDYFGRENFGIILGFATGIMMIGNITGAPLAGWIFDTWGTYQWAWLGYGAVTVAGAILVFTIPSSSGTIQQSDKLTPVGHEKVS